METILSPFSASISELKKNPTALLHQANGSPVVILNHNRPTAYLVPANVYENMLELLEEYELGLIVRKRLAEEADKAIEVDLNAL